jgi:hypothetical protein
MSYTRAQLVNKALSKLGVIAEGQAVSDDSLVALILVIAARIASLDGDAVKASDLASTLRLDPESLGTLVATNPPEPVPVAEPVAEPAKAAPAPAPAPAAKA